MRPDERAEQAIAWFKCEAKYNRRVDKYEWPGVLVWAGLNVRITDAIAAAILAEREACAEIAKDPYSDAVQARAGDEPKLVGKLIARAIHSARTAQGEGKRQHL